jgi:hypothetical protein
MRREDQPSPIMPWTIARMKREKSWRDYKDARRLDLRTRPCECYASEEEILDAALRGYVDEHGHGLTFALTFTDMATPSGDPLAEWIFARHVRPAKKQTFKSLYEEAREDLDIGPGLKREDFHTSYRTVYVTKPNAPPAGGWPLQPEYQKRWQAQTGG